MKTANKKQTSPPAQKIDLSQFQGEKKLDQIVKPVNFYQYQIDWANKNKIVNFSAFIRRLLDDAIKASK